ncbi:NapC/NirT family cytochrome c [Ferrimonas marina]|uniref:Cytochrome c-type protein n=1 Tax=Ferrimonas marina TaxID=299255 RepID=A0A1M5YVC1_9GAMM|nr:NapC/NirT family cytochrome c [Ferrimonas marina]SHI15804.1 Tetraheme cytochrome c subunit of nitrate or TMAO reductase [Ferrimonas marina]
MNWRKLFKPSSRYSVSTLVAVGVVIGVVGYFAMQQTLHATSTDEFCMTCHSNHSLKDEVLASAHGNNRAGVVVQCQQCHIAQEPFNYLVKKIVVSKDIWGYLTIDGFNTQEWLEANRKEQADLALAYLKRIDSSTCQNCHNQVTQEAPEAMKTMAARMHAANYKKEPDQRRTCVDCHKGVAHPYPKG